MNVPDRIFAVGSVGKDIALAVLDTDWLLDTVLEPSSDPDSLTVTILDSPRENAATDRIEAVREHIAKRERAVRAGEGRTGTITVDYDPLAVPGEFDSGQSDSDGLDTEATGDEWWMETLGAGAERETAGTIKRGRTIGKAALGAVEDEAVPDISAGEQIAILAGLGDGPGSGAVIDLARELREQQPSVTVTLFAVLPARTDGVTERANAFGALSELECSALEGNDYFTDRVLLPVSPTNGPHGSDIPREDSHRALTELIGNLLLSYYNCSGSSSETDLAGSPRPEKPPYAPFTVGVTQTLRYEVEQIQETRRHVRELLDVKSEVLDLETDVYGRVESLLDSYAPPNEKRAGALQSLEKAELETRIEAIETWREFEVLGELGYCSISALEEAFQNGVQAEDEITERIRHIGDAFSATNGHSSGADRFADDLDERLSELLGRELGLLKRRVEILERVQEIEDIRVREAVESVVWSGNAGLSEDQPKRLDDRRTQLQDRQEQLATELEETVEQLEGKREERTGDVEQQLADWMHDVERDLQRLRRLDADTVQSTLSRLDARLDQFTNAVVDAVDTEELDRVSEENVLAAIDELAELLEFAGVENGDVVDSLAQSVRQLPAAKRAFFGIHGVTEVENARDRYRKRRESLQNAGVFQLGSPANGFEVTIRFDSASLFEACQDRSETIREAIVSDLERRVDDPPERHLDALETELESSQPDIERVRETARKIIRQELGETSELEVRKTELESRILEIERKRELYDETIDCFRTVQKERERWGERKDAFEELLAEYSADSSEAVAGTDSRYVERLNPEDPFRVLSHPDISPDALFAMGEERRRIRHQLEAFAENATKPRYNALERTDLSTGRGRYEHLTVDVTVMSSAPDTIETDLPDFRESVGRAFGRGTHEEDGYTERVLRAGDPWEISLSVFVSGVFLDNLRPLVERDGYHSAYRKRAEKLGQDVAYHHSYRLERGEYVRRKDFLNLDIDRDVDFYLREDDIVEDLLNGFIEIEEMT